MAALNRAAGRVVLHHSCCQVLLYSLYGAICHTAVSLHLSLYKGVSQYNSLIVLVSLWLLGSNQ